MEIDGEKDQRVEGSLAKSLFWSPDREQCVQWRMKNNFWHHIPIHPEDKANSLANNFKHKLNHNSSVGMQVLKGRH